MRLVVHILPAVLFLLTSAAPSRAACGDSPGDAQAVANTRAQIAEQCDCAGAKQHASYVRCAAKVTNQAVRSGMLSKDCAEVVMACAGNSTCGKRGAVTCCQTDAQGAMTCSIKNGPDKCTPPSGGSACVGTQSSCCDACVGGGCAGGTTTTTLATTTTTVATTTTTMATTTTLATTTTTVATTTTTVAPTTTTLATTTTTVVTTTTTLAGTTTTVATTTTTVATTTTTLAGTTTTVATTTTLATTTTTVATTTTTLATTTTTTTTTSTSTTAITIPVTSTTTTSTTTTTTTVPTCTCAGGTPTRQSSTTGVGAGNCGHLDADGNPNFFPLACGGLYFGGAGVGVPLPSTIPDLGTSIAKATCNGTTLTLTGTTPAETGGNRCSGGTNHHNACTTNADCPGGACKFLLCSNAGCLFGPPLPVPNGAHAGAATSTCVINTVTANGSGTSDCAAGTTTNYDLPLGATLFLAGDLLPNRCVGGSTPGAGCGGAACSTGTSACPGGGTCTNDTGRCTDNGAPCCSDGDCSITATCETGACVGGTNDGKGCITTADCPGTGAKCRTFIQPCPICEPTTNTCNGGPNDGLACTPGASPVDGDFPSTHDCPPPTSLNIGTLAIGFRLDTGTISKVAVDNLPDQPNVFCGFCRNKTVDTFARKCNGSPTGANCTADANCTAGQHCLPVPCNPANGNADCAAATGFTSCGQRTAGAFTPNDVARTIVETGSPAGPLTTGGAAEPQTLVSIFCIPPSFSTLVDAAADLPGPGAAALEGTTQLQ